jgi:peptide/nickel transport system substrate-binding protein
MQRTFDVEYWPIPIHLYALCAAINYGLAVMTGLTISRFRRLRRWPMFVASTLPLASWARADPPSAPIPEVRFALSNDTPTSMPGNILRNADTDEILANVVESLVALKGDLSVGPMLANSWDISPDGKRYTFHLRHGVRFHNGAPLTSAEVKWSYAFWMKSQTGYVCRGNYNGQRGPKVLAMTTPDSHTVVFELDRSSALFLTRMAELRCPFAILDPSSVDANGVWIKPVATGPFVFSEWKQGQYVLLKRFSGYRSRSEPASGLAGAKRPGADVRFVAIPDEAAQLSALMSGQIDAMNISENSVPPRDPARRLISGPGADPAVLLMQTRDPLLSDVRMRRAIALAVDLPGVVDAVSDGRARYNPSLTPEADALHTDADAVGYKQSLAEVKRLLSEVGYTGQTLTLETNRRYPHMYSAAVYMQSLLSQAGINVKLQVLEWGKQSNDFHSGHFQMMTFGYSARIEPAMMYADVLGDKSVNPMVQWENPAALTLLHSIDGVTDSEARKHVFAQLHRMMLADVPMIVMNDSPDLTLVSSEVQGMGTWPLRLKRLFNVTKN